MTKKVRKFKNFKDIFDTTDKYLLDEYEEDFDYSNIFRMENKKHRNSYNENDY